MGEFAGSDAGQQRLTALEHANRVRLARARMKRQIGGGQLAAAEVVLHCPWQAYKMPISDVLMSQKRWGTTRCRRALVAVGIPENKPVGTLTDRQREALVATLGGAGEKPEGGAGVAVAPAPPNPPPQAHPAMAARAISRERALSAV